MIKIVYITIFVLKLAKGIIVSSMDSISELNKRSFGAFSQSIKQVDIPSISDQIEDQDDACGEFKRKPIKKSTLLSKKHYKKQKIEDIFKSIIRSITLTPQKRSLDPQRQTKIPHSLVNTLYRQNIRNYNPYIATLQLLQQQKSLTLFEKQKISNLCHIGVAKNFIKTKKFGLAPKYATVNVLIRNYMRDKMWEQVKYKEQNYDSVFFIPTNDLALTFNSQKVPQGVQDFMPKEYYTNIINEVNNIITTEYVRYKSSNLINITQSLSGKLILGVLLLISLLFCFNQNVYLLPVMFAVGVLYIFYLIHQTKVKLERLVQSKNVNSTIIEKISTLFEKIRTDMIEWKVGRDFYWLQIHYIKKKRRNF